MPLSGVGLVGFTLTSTGIGMPFLLPINTNRTSKDHGRQASTAVTGLTVRVGTVKRVAFVGLIPDG